MEIDKQVSPFIASQFPFHYRESYPQLVEFMRMYYAWLEQSDQAIGHAKRLPEYRDIDETPEEYIQYFKNKYLPYIKFVTDIDKRTLVKHVLDLYRAKGTERGIDLFFKLVYGVPAQVYYPSTDLFKLSDNTWLKRKYLEIGHIELIDQYVGKKITGTRSGATAFAEKFIQKKVGDTYVNLLFISDVVGHFMYKEKLTVDDLDITDKKRPRVVGSLTNLNVTSGSKDFKVGDLVDMSSNNGYGAIGRVSRVYNATGLIDFELEDGGWGYTSNSSVYISDRVLTLQNVAVDFAVNNPDKAPYISSPYFILEKVYQPLANLNYKFDVSNQNLVVERPGSDWYAVGATLYQTNSTATNSSIGVVVSNSSVNSTIQNLVIAVAKSNASLFDFSTTTGEFSNIYLSTNSSINSVVLSVNTSTDIGSIAVGTNLTSYYSNGTVISTVQVVNNEIANIVTKTANLFVYLTSGNSQVNTYFWSPSNTFSINVSAYVDRTATGNVVGVSNNLTLYISNSTTTFTPGQYLTQRRTYTGGYDISARGKIVALVGAGNTFTVELSEATGPFRRTVNVHMQYSNGTESGQLAYLNSYDASIGLANINNGFVSTGNNRVFTQGWTLDGNGMMIIRGSNSVANVISISEGKNATFAISNSTTPPTLAYAETYSLYTDFVGGNNVSNTPYMDLTISNTTAFANSLTLTFTAGVNSIAVTGGTADIDLGTNWYVAGEGLSDFSEIISKNTTHIVVDPAPWDASNASYAYRLTPVSGIAWGFPANSSGTIQYFIGDVLNAINGYVGGITKLISVNPGEDYNRAPFVLVREPFVAGFNAKDYILTVDSAKRRQSVVVVKPASSWYANGATLYQTNSSSTNSSVGIIVSNSAVNATHQNLAIDVTRSNTSILDFSVTGGGFSNVVLSTNSSVNSVVLSVNTSVNVPVGNFIVGEQITQNNGAVGLIKTIETANNKVLYVRRQTLPVGNVTLGNATVFTMSGVITGQATGTDAMIVGVREDDTALGVGMNALVSANIVTGNGVVGNIEIIASGYSFIDNENLTFLSRDGLRAGTAKVSLMNEGISEGVLMDSSSFVSDSKYLFDGDYYQEYSYDIKSAIPRDSYLDNYNKTMHLAGTKMFSTYVHVSKNDISIDVSLPEESANLQANVA